jgi:2-phosphoxylose phosphatase
LHGTCLFPQITKGGLDDSIVHGQNLATVYKDLLGFIPKIPDSSVWFRVTNNPITTQIAGKVIEGLYPGQHDKIPLHVQQATIDSLEPTYSCTAAQTLFGSFGPGSNDPTWQSHLNAAQALYATLDSISGVSPTDSGFHISFDHYFDNLSSNQCHKRGLPCSPSNSSNCIPQDSANTVYRLGQWEYSWIYRGAPNSLQASVASYGAWFAELAQNIRDAVAGKDGPIYRHNVAHDGSVSRVLSVLQVDKMMWPGMGSEVVFEVYRRKQNQGGYALRALWSGSVLQSTSPSLGKLDMIDLNVFLQYVDGLVGQGGSKLLDLCSAS